MSDIPQTKDCEHCGETLTFFMKTMSGNLLYVHKDWVRYETCARNRYKQEEDLPLDLNRE